MKNFQVNRLHSASQNYKTPEGSVGRPRYDSVSSMRSEKPEFKKLAPITCTDYAQALEEELTPKPVKQRNYSMNGRNSERLSKKYHSCNENITISSLNNKKLDKAIQRQKKEKLGYFINCASDLLKKKQNSSLRNSVDGSLGDFPVDFSTPKQVKGRNSRRHNHFEPTLKST